MALYCSREAHYSVRRAGEVLGIGSRYVRAIAIDADRRMDPAACAAAIDEDRRAGIVPVAVVASAGTTLTGAVDDLEALADVCEQRQVWLHVDGAYGLPAAATSSRRTSLSRAGARAVGHRGRAQVAVCAQGVQRSADARPRRAGAGVLPRGELHAPQRRAPARSTARSNTRDRCAALKLWLAFTVHGADAIRRAIERNLEEAQLLAALLEADEHFELLATPQLSAVCFRHLPEHPTDADAHNAALTRALAADGRILLASATVDGTACLRACMVNHRTTEDDVRTIPPVVNEVAGALSAGGR